tara:strand:+ start:821 stop:3382 length:2562 start_codon:yes stop_codon:yes gene_type:complete
MALINTSLPNLIQGVSQQPDTLRFDGQCDEQINALSSVTDGLKKRPNARFIKQLESLPLADGAFVHFINRDKQERYVLIINNNKLKVYNIFTGLAVVLDDSSNATEIDLSSNSYLNITDTTKPRDIFKALTVNDNTFILNTTKKVGRTNSSKSNAFTHADNNKALIFIKQGHHNTRYNIKIKHGNNTFKGAFGSERSAPDSSGNVNNQAGRIANKLRLAIAQALKEGSLSAPEQEAAFTANGFTLGVVEGIDKDEDKEHIIANDQGGNDEAYLYPLFEISRTDGTPFEITVSDSKSGTALGVAYKEVDSISDLPKVAPNNFRIKVRGSVDDNEDDYYVKFETNDGSVFGNGGYIEDVGFDEFIQLDGDTLPFKLVNTAPNTFSFGACTWTTKQVGDNDTNPFPSFFNLDADSNPDRSISNIFFYKNRLGFLSEGSVILSESGEYFNFFRTTVRSLLDSDPIDVNVASTKVTKLKSAVGFQENLILFGERGQFVLRGGELLTPKTVSITPITNFETDTSTTPLELGSYIYFPFTRGSFSGMREFTVNANVDTYDSVEITSHVPQYIPANIIDVAGSTSENAICVLSSTDTNSIYIYKYYWEGNQKVLASWSKFTFAFTILGFEFIESDLFIVATKNGATQLLKMPMEEKLIDTGASFNTYLDMRVEGVVNSSGVVVVDNVANLPYTPENTDTVQVYTRESGSTKAGALLPCTVNDNVVTVDSSHDTTPVWVGIKYTMSYTFSEQLFRQRANKRTSPSGYQRHFLKGGTLFFDDTSSFKVEVTPKARQTYTNVFSSHIVGSTVVGTLPIESGSFSFPIMSSAKDTEIKLINETGLPSNFQSAEFESFIHSRSRRV